MLPFKINLPMAMAITCMLKTATMAPCLETVTNVSSISYYNTLTPPYYPPNGECTSFYVPISLDYQGASFTGTKWTNPFELQDALSSLTATPREGNPLPLGALTTFKGDYEIAASFCTPRKKNGKEGTVILATHGIGPARTHWNSPFKPEEYNFVQFALDKGYSVWFYDRLGCGASSRINGFEAQLQTAKTVIQTLSTAIKSGKYTPGINKVSKLIVMGFSFGSYATHAAIAEKPEIADAVVLTGIGLNETGINLNGLVRSFVPRIANVENSALYGDRDDGYLTWPSVYDLVMNYFKAPSFTSEAALFTESAKEPFSAGEFLTFSSSAPTSAENWTKPALHITGEKDYIVCDGYCPGVFDEPAKTLYKNAKPLQQTLIEGASHHINFLNNATGAFGVITEFLDKNL